MVAFVVGIVVGASAAALLMILIAPSRRVRAERPLPRETETQLLLGQDPERDPTPEPPTAEPERQYTANELAALQRIGQEQAQQRRRKH